MDRKPDFSGWATRANMLCGDGRTIMKDAFKECDGEIVPLVWNHEHNQPEKVLGHALLENRDEGVYAYGFFNDTECGQTAKLLVRHGDVNRLSIYANRLQQQGAKVIHGVIRELSLVLAGANPGAIIDSVIMHGDDFMEEGYIRSGDLIENVEALSHADAEEKGKEDMKDEKKENSVDNAETVEDVLKTLSEKQLKTVYALVGMALKESKSASEEKTEEETKPVKHAESEDDADETIGDVLDTLTDKQRKVVEVIIGTIVGDKDDDDFDDEDDEDDKGGNKNMKHNVFDEQTNAADILTHSEMMEIMEDAQNIGSMRKAFLQHGITNIDYLFPDAQNVTDAPQFIQRNMDWVSDVMNSVHKTPFSRIKSVLADITEADARAKGYVKGAQKLDEVFSLLKRVTTPTTIYKKQSLDRDDMIDITELDTVAWLKMELRMMLDEELARAILVGDGRNASSADKINEGNIRPIWTDDDVYTVKQVVNVTADMTEDQKAREFIKATIRSRKSYKGSGNPTMYMSEDMLTNCLLIEDKNGRIIYDSIDKLATALRCSKIVSVPVMEDLKRTADGKEHALAGIYVNLMDYNVGADKGGAVNMFDDFDIDYNKQKYLIETRCSGAMIKPYAAVAIEFVDGTTKNA